MRLKIGAKEIGDECPTFIVAEIGSNWTTLEDCLASIRAAKCAGADAVKFQAYDALSLYGLETQVRGELPTDWLPALKQEADNAGIEFMCTAFSPELYDRVDPFVNVHKVASAELTHVRMLEKLRTLGKPVILSTGASGEDDVKNALKVLSDVPVILMYCVAAYPARMIHFGVMNELLKFGTLIGYSDHSTDALVVPVVATSYGACVIEKHVTFIDAETPDSPHSLNEREFKAMAEQLRGGSLGRIGATAEENGMVSRHNRRLLATRNISVGEPLHEDINFGIYRSLKSEDKAMIPWDIGLVEGKTAKNDIIAGDGISPKDIGL